MAAGGGAGLLLEVLGATRAAEEGRWAGGCRGGAGPRARSCLGWRPRGEGRRPRPSWTAPLPHRLHLAHSWTVSRARLRTAGARQPRPAGGGRWLGRAHLQARARARAELRHRRLALAWPLLRGPHAGRKVQPQAAGTAKALLCPGAWPSAARFSGPCTFPHWANPGW